MCSSQARSLSASVSVSLSLIYTQRNTPELLSTTLRWDERASLLAEVKLGKAIAPLCWSRAPKTFMVTHTLLGGLVR